MPRTSTRANERSSEEAIGFALSHRTRVEILSTLSEGDYGASELGKMLGISLSTVQYHLEELLTAGSIEVARTEPARNFEKRIFRAMAPAFFTEDEMASWPFEKLQSFYGLILQNAAAEAMAALHAGTISRNPRSWLTWARFNVDSRGWNEMYDLVESTWQRFKEIEADSAKRETCDGNQCETFVWSFQGYPRSRTGRSSYPCEE